MTCLVEFRSKQSNAADFGDIVIPGIFDRQTDGSGSLHVLQNVHLLHTDGGSLCDLHPSISLQNGNAVVRHLLAMTDVLLHHHHVEGHGLLEVQLDRAVRSVLRAPVLVLVL